MFAEKCPNVEKDAIACVSRKRTGDMPWLSTKSASKRLKSDPGETCDIIIDINKHGSCKFKIIPLETKPARENGHIDTFCCSSNGIDGNASNGLNAKRQTQSGALKDETGFPPLSNYVALDCEFVGVRNDQSALGRCSIVDWEGQVLCDLYAMPEDPITHYRTRWSGITKHHMKNAIPQEFALAKISNILEGKIVVGHDLTGDFKVLGFRPRREFIRDTSTFRGLMGPARIRKSLKNLALEYLGIQIQIGSHCSIQDARTAMSLYRLVRHEWETSLLAKNPKNGNQSNPPETNQSGNSDSTSSSCSSNPSDAYWDIKNPGNCKVDCSKIEPVLENAEGKLSVLKKIKSDSCLVVKAKSRKTNKNKRKNILKTHFGQINTKKLSVNDYFSTASQVINQDTKINCLETESSVINQMCDIVVKQAEEKVSKTLRPNDCSKNYVDLSSTVDHLYDDKFWPDFDER